MIEIEGFKDEKPSRETYDHTQIQVLLTVARPELKPFFALLAFAGVRHAECLRLKWSDIDLKEGVIKVEEHIAKTGQRRVIPIEDNLREWLAIPDTVSDVKVIGLLLNPSDWL